MSILPKKNKLGFYEIRLESIGGLDTNLAGKMLAEAGVLGLGLNGSDFSSYGSKNFAARYRGRNRTPLAASKSFASKSLVMIFKKVVARNKVRLSSPNQG